MESTDQSEMRSRFLDAAIEDFEERSNGDYCLVIRPLGDALGFRAEILVGGVEAFLGGCSSLRATEAAITAISRALANLEELREEAEQTGLTGEAGVG